MSATDHDKSYCPRCGQSSGVTYQAKVMLPVVDPQSGRITDEVRFDNYKCTICRHKWRERSAWQ